MPRRMFLLSFLLLLAAIFGGLSPKPIVRSAPKPAPLFTNISVYGAWHCGNDFCTWASVRNMTDFDTRNRWIINRGDGTPSVNLIVLSFVHPMRLLNKTNDAGNSQGIPIDRKSVV